MDKPAQFRLGKLKYKGYLGLKFGESCMRLPKNEAARSLSSSCGAVSTGYNNKCNSKHAHETCLSWLYNCGSKIDVMSCALKFITGLFCLYIIGHIKVNF